MLISFCIFLCIVPGARAQEVTPEINPLVDQYQEQKQKIASTEQISRRIMGSMYQINEKMKVMSKKRSVLADRIAVTEGKIKELSKIVVQLEGQISHQRSNLSKRLKAIYMLGDDGMARILFSSANAQELDQSLKYLKIISEYDYKNIKAYQKNLDEYHAKQRQVKNEIKSLLKLRENLNVQEQLLASEQHTKHDLLINLETEKKSALKNLKGLRQSASENYSDDILDLSFYEQKGQLPVPVHGELERGFGLIENKKFKYILSHKGLLFRANELASVRSVFNGRVAFVGEVPGYGQTIVVDHGDHYYSVYARATQLLVYEGQKISSNETIAKASDELYFEIRHFSDAIDPKPWLSRSKQMIKEHQ